MTLLEPRSFEDDAPEPLRSLSASTWLGSMAAERIQWSTINRKCVRNGSGMDPWHVPIEEDGWIRVRFLFSLEDAAVSRGNAATRGSSAVAMIPEPTEPVGEPPEGYSR